MHQHDVGRNVIPSYMRVRSAPVADGSPIADIIRLSKRERLMKKLLIAIMSIAGLSCNGDENRLVLRAESLLKRASSYLWSKQGADGGWHSETHGILRGGQAWTPFVLLALADVPGDAHPASAAGVDLGLEFIRTHLNDAGTLGLSDPDVLEYPNYATSYALRLLVRHGREADSALAVLMKLYLVSQQLTERRGFTPAHPAYGAWGFGETSLPPGEPGFADLSHTRRVLQALRETGHADSASYRNAEPFLRFLQKHPSEPRAQVGGDSITAGLFYDGGFYFSPVVTARNKGGLDDEGVFRSYATATCDGALALHYAGIPQSDERIVSALGWLARHPLLSQPEGIPEDTPEGWQDVVFFYHLLVRSEVYSVFGSDLPWREEIVSLLETRQRSDGSFANPHGELNKEDDPILATAMVVYTLMNVLR
jgi:hypothetical protein